MSENLRVKLKELKDKAAAEGICSVIFSAFSHAFSYALWLASGRRKWEKEVRDPAAVKQNKIIFESFDTYPDNETALYEYMIRQGFDREYEIVWLADHPEECRRFFKNYQPKVVKRQLACGKMSAEALRELHSSKYVFYTASVSWADVMRKEQVFIDLWHGCSFKDVGRSQGKSIAFDYLLVPGPLFVKLKAEFFSCPEEKILPLGYPRYDMLIKGSRKITDSVSVILSMHNCRKLVFWMPTFRKARREYLTDDTLQGSEYDLPVIYDRKMLENLNDLCRKHKVLLWIKRHQHARAKSIDTKSLSNIGYIDDRWLKDMGASLYAFLHETDALITDYSSVGIDYLLIDRPIAYTLDDFEEYKASRGFTVEDPLHYMPGHYIYRFEDFERFISDLAGGKDPYREDRARAASELHIDCRDYCANLLDRFNISLSKQ